jgi:hypothetical protein
MCVPAFWECGLRGLSSVADPIVERQNGHKQQLKAKASVRTARPNRNRVLVLAHCWARKRSHPHPCVAARRRAAHPPRTTAHGLYAPTRPTPNWLPGSPAPASTRAAPVPRTTEQEQGHARYSECASASQLTNRTGAKQQQAEAEGRVSACGRRQRAGPAASPSEREQVLIEGVRTFRHRLKHTISTGVPTACPTLDQRRCLCRGRLGAEGYVRRGTCAVCRAGCVCWPVSCVRRRGDRGVATWRRVRDVRVRVCRWAASCVQVCICICDTS